MSEFKINIQPKVNEIHTLNELCTSQTTILELKNIIINDDRYNNINDINSFKLKYNNIELLNDNNLEFYNIIDSRNIIRLYFNVTQSNAYNNTTNDNKNDDTFIDDNDIKEDTTDNDVDISLTIGQTILIKDETSRFVEAIITSVDDNKNNINVHYIDYPDFYDERINIFKNQHRFHPKQIKQLMGLDVTLFKVGQKLSVKDKMAQFIPAIITKLNQDHSITVHYIGYPDIYDEIIRNENRIKKPKEKNRENTALNTQESNSNINRNICCERNRSTCNSWNNISIVWKALIIMYDLVIFSAIGIYISNIFGFIDQLIIYGKYNVKKYGCERISTICRNDLCENNAQNIQWIFTGYLIYMVIQITILSGLVIFINFIFPKRINGSIVPVITGYRKTVMYIIWFGNIIFGNIHAAKSHRMINIISNNCDMNSDLYKIIHDKWRLFSIISVITTYLSSIFPFCFGQMLTDEEQ